MAKTTPKVRFFCFHCFEPVSAPVEHIGRKGQCPRCGKLTRIPPTSTRGPNRSALVGSADQSAALRRTPAVVETGALPAVAASSLDDSAVAPSPGESGAGRDSSNGAPATGPAAPRPVVDRQKIEVWKEVFRGKPAEDAKVPVDKPKYGD